MGDHNSCQCDECRAACERKPGFFLPGEAEILAANMGLTLQELFDRHLMVEQIPLTDDIFGKYVGVLSPAVVGREPGTRFPFLEPRGTCVFFQNGRCTVHVKGKPHECRVTIHHSAQSGRETRRDYAADWLPHQATIAPLLRAHVPQATIVDRAFNAIFRGAAK